VEIVGLTDIEVDFPMPLTQLFPNVPLAAWAPHRQRYPEVFPRPDTWRPHFGGFLLRSQGRTILVDTGMGSTVTNPGAVAMFTGGADGHLLEELHAVAAYVNDLGDEGEERAQSAYGENYARLVALKTKYDPTNFFRLNQNLTPMRTAPQ